LNVALVETRCTGWRWTTWVAVTCLTLIVAGHARAQDDRPNIPLIVADDAGYADLGSFGGEIQTPNPDALAAVGIRFTRFNASVTCWPTRSMLLSGTDNHAPGVGSMAESRPPTSWARRATRAT